MNRKIKLALAALLGFSSACSTARHAPSKDPDVRQTDPAPELQPGSDRPRIMVMYGVRPPQNRNAQAPTIDPVAERPVDSLDVVRPRPPSGE